MCCTRGHTALTAEHVVLKLGMHWYGWVVMRKVANLLCPDFWTLSGKVLKKKGKALLSLEPANHTEPGKLLYGQEDTAGSDRHRKSGSWCTGDPWESREQVNRQATDVRKMTEFSEALSGDLVIFALTEKKLKTAQLESKTEKDHSAKTESVLILNH